MKYIAVMLLLTPFFATASSDFGNAQLGKVKAPSCVFCHGADGIASNPSYPHLKGQNVQYLYQSMKDYQDGNRQGAMAEMMKAQLSRLNDQDLKDIAAYFASQE